MAPYSIGYIGTETIAVGGHTVLTIDYQPTATGTTTEQIYVYSDGGTGVVTVSGTATPGFTFTTTVPDPVAFGSIPHGTSKTLTYTVTNTSSIAGGVSFYYDDLEGVPAWAGLSTSGDVSLAAGQTHNVTLTFAPTSTGTLDAMVAWIMGPLDQPGVAGGVTGTAT